MAILTQYKTEEEIPDALKEHCTEVGGIWVTDVTDIETHPKVVKLKNAYTREKEKRDAQATAIADAQLRIDAMPEDYTPERWEELKLAESKMVDPDKQKEAIKKQLDENRLAVKKDLEEKHRIEKEAQESKISTLSKFLEKTIKEDRLRSGLVSAGIDKAFLAGAMALLAPRVKIEQDGDEFKDIVDTDLGDVSAKDYATQWVTTDEGKPYVSKASGPELDPKRKFNLANDNNNPWITGNLTQQSIILTTEPAKAEKLKAAAVAAKK
jgi:hypothetical protein